jgi:hypothetical protein
MKKLLMVISLLVVLVAAVTGCGGAHRYDARLVAADSLMQSAPDSALALVEALPAGSLPDEGDRAYRDLLLTQARYRNYIVATSDSDINRALSYYRAHAGEREKLTRAFIYKGTVMEELSHPDSAMYYYKHAEATADENDYANLGQINTRIADLYRIHYGDEQTCFDKYKTALDYYHKIGNKPLQMNCLYNMAMCAGITREAEPEQYFNQACEIATELNDSLQLYKCYELYCRQLSLEETKRRQAKQLALKCLNNFAAFVDVDLVLDLAYLYAVEHKPDSAEHYLRLIDDSKAYRDQPERIQVRIYKVLSSISENRGEMPPNQSFRDSVNQILDSISNDKVKYSIQGIENTNNQQVHQAVIKKKSLLSFLLWIVVTLLLLLSGLFIALHYRRARYFKSIIEEIQQTSIEQHEKPLEQLDTNDAAINRYIGNMIALLKIAFEHKKKGLRLQNDQEFKNLVADIADEEFWTALEKHLNEEHNNVIRSLTDANPNLKKKDLRFIELLCCGFSYLEIAFTLGYAPNYISRKRQDLAKKLNTVIPLQDRLDELMRARQ